VAAVVAAMQAHIDVAAVQELALIHI